MRYPQQVTASRHEKILEEASRLFRERGLEGAGVAEIMKAAQLTHGGFYAHFDSKEHLAAEACARAVAEMQGHIERAAAREDAVPAFTQQYLSPAHRDHPGSGCALAALAPEMARQSDRVRSAFTEELRKVIEMMAEEFPFRRGRDTRAESIRLLASLVGALALARATNDETLSNDILKAVRDQ